MEKNIEKWDDIIELGKINGIDSWNILEKLGDMESFLDKYSEKWEKIVELGKLGEDKSRKLLEELVKMQDFLNTNPDKLDDIVGFCKKFKEESVDLLDIISRVQNFLKKNPKYLEEIVKLREDKKNNSKDLIDRIADLQDFLVENPEKFYEVVELRENSSEKDRMLFFQLSNMQDFLKYNPDKLQDIIGLGKTQQRGKGMFFLQLRKMEDFLKENPDKLSDIIKLREKDGGKRRTLFFQLVDMQKFLKEHPEKFEVLVELGIKCEENQRELFCGLSNIQDFLLDYPEKLEEVSKWFISKIIRSKGNMDLLKRISDKGFFRLVQFNNIFSYLLDNKQKQIMSFLQKVYDIEILDLNLDITKFKDLEDMKEEFGRLDKEEIKKNYSKILEITEKTEKIKYKKKYQLKDILEIPPDDGEIENKLRKQLGEALYNYFQYMFDRKLKINIKDFIKNNLVDESLKDIDVGEILEKNMKLFKRESFVEGFKILKSTEINRKQGIELLKRSILSLSGKKNLYPHMPYQYNTPNNIERLENNMKRSTQKKWLDSNRKEINISDEENGREEKEYIERRINDYFEVALSKIRRLNERYNLGFEERFYTPGQLVNYFDCVIRTRKKRIESQEKKYNISLFEKLNYQISRIQESFKLQKQKNIEKLIIEKETDPFRILMMGNRVEGSCLSFYHNTKNFYGAITNAIEVNKGVFYIKDQKEQVIGRVLVGIDKNRNFVRFPLYISGNIGLNLDRYFDEYLKELSEIIGVGLNGKKEKICLIEGDIWYNEDKAKKIEDKD